VDLRIFTEPQQGASYDQILAVAKATEDGGFDAFFRSDHYLHMGDVSGLPDSLVIVVGQPLLVVRQRQEAVLSLLKRARCFGAATGRGTSHYCPVIIR